MENEDQTPLLFHYHRLIGVLLSDSLGRITGKSYRFMMIPLTMILLYLQEVTLCIFS